MDCTSFRDQMLDVLYGETDALTALRVAEHQASCPTCREEMEALRRVRGRLAAWDLPDLPPVGRPAASRFARTGPRRAWLGLAAAAALVLSAGTALGLSGSELRFEDGRVAFRLGRAGGQDFDRLLVEQEARHRAEIEALRAEIGQLPARAVPARVSDDDLLRRVAALIEESEVRQARAVQASLADLRVRTEAQRRYDLARVSAGLSYLDGKTGQDVARATELMGYVLQASQKR